MFGDWGKNHYFHGEVKKVKKRLCHNYFMHRPKRPKSSSNGELARAVNGIDRLRLFEQFEEQIGPSLRKALADGKTVEEILGNNKEYVAARLITIAMTEEDSGRALVAIKDLLDRTGGKATERKELTHKLEKLSDRELDALLVTEIADTDLDGSDDK